MTTAVTLTTAWQEVANSDSFFASFTIECGEVHYAFDDSAPSDPNYHTVYEDIIIAGQMPSGLWARVASDDCVAGLSVDEWAGPMDVGSGLNLLNVAVNVVAIRG